MPFDKRTRYGELLYNLAILADIATILDEDGIDVYTLNKTGLHSDNSSYIGFHGDRFSNVKSTRQVKNIFSVNPKGGTNLTECFNAVVYDHEKKNTIKPLVILVSTDGQPNNSRTFNDAVVSRDPSRYFVTFIVCSDNDMDVDYLNSFDNLPSIDIIDDYRTEKKQVRKVQGKHFSYSRGDHEIRKICGSVFRELDAIDERPCNDFPEPGPTDLPEDIGKIIVELSNNHDFVKKQMLKYAKTNRDIAVYMRDVTADACCIM